MSSTLLERTRASHEGLDRLHRQLVAELKEAPRTHKKGVDQSHRVKFILESIVDTSASLEKVYADADGSRKDAIASIAGTGPSLYSLFYDRLREVKDYHRKYPNLEVERPENLHIPTAEIPFTGEEKYGKYLDLHELYDQYVNIPGIERVDYLSYLRKFSQFDKLPAHRLYNKQYKKYIDGLQQYFQSFFKRTQPLLDLDKELQPTIKEFEEKWEKGEFNDHKTKQEEQKTNGTTNANSTNQTTKAAAPAGDQKRKNKKRGKGKKDKSAEPGADAENDMNVDAVRIINFSHPLYCRACAKLFCKDTVFNAHFAGNKHQEAAAAATQLRKDILLDEAKAGKMGEMLTEEIHATHNYVEHKQSLLPDELEKEMEDEEAAEEDPIDYDEPEDVEPIRMTIKDYPIGWDGKPIPYWLYKLHGLGVEYKCEICGNTSYFGRKAFEKHFQEWRHAYGMACLKIPNTRHFQEITRIADAAALWIKVQEDEKKTSWKPDAEEEYEDSEGHVLSRKTFEDLRRQGLLE